MKGGGETPIVTNAYAVLPKDDEQEVAQVVSTHHHAPTAVAHAGLEVPVSAVVLDRPARQLFAVNPTYAHIPETHGLQWHDDFFEDETDVIAVFDLDYSHMEAYYGRLGWTCWTGGALCLPGFLTLSLLSCLPCYLNNNVHWNIRAQHVAVTREGVRFVHDKRKTLWGWPCTDAGRYSKTIPFDQITTCEIEEPAGHTCGWVPNQLHTVHLDTAKSASQCGHELTLTGLQDPHGFQKLVRAMKQRAQASTAATSSVARLPEALSMIDRGIANNDDGQVAELLRDIRDELRQQNRGQGGPAVAAAQSSPSAPVAQNAKTIS